MGSAVLIGTSHPSAERPIKLVGLMVSMEVFWKLVSYLSIQMEGGDFAVRTRPCRKGIEPRFSESRVHSLILVCSSCRWVSSINVYALNSADTCSSLDGTWTP
jgi:hypothetical protein